MRALILAVIAVLALSGTALGIRQASTSLQIIPPTSLMAGGYVTFEVTDLPHQNDIITVENTCSDHVLQVIPVSFAIGGVVVPTETVPLSVAGPCEAVLVATRGGTRKELYYLAYQVN